MLDTIKEPRDIKKFSVNELKKLSNEIREFLIDSISKTGGHIGANLGVIELTIALHYVFNVPDDAILFDVGHQGYTHKLITGRKKLFPTLNSPGGMSRFISKKESSFDELDASHAGTAISTGAGMATGFKLNNSKNTVISIVGDGALVEGMSFEGLNFATEKKIPFIIVINDNGMSIPKNIGGISKLFAGKKWHEKSKAYFSSLGFRYFSVEDGHNMDSLVATLKEASTAVREGIVIVHVKTEKGMGLELAKSHPYKMHFSMPFDPLTGSGCSPVPAGVSYAKIAGDTIYELLKKDKDVVVLTPATPYASGIEQCLAEFPDNVIDVGMAEQHALGMAAGLAIKNKKVFVCYQSTFMQRAMDQIIHDVCYLDLPVTIISARSGFAGFDSPTHHGIYDLSYLRGLPNLNIFYAGTSYDLRRIIRLRSEHADGPLIILHPYENVYEHEDKYFSASVGDIQKPCVVAEGTDGFIFAVGNRIATAIELRERLQKKKQDFGVMNIRWINPLPIKQLLSIMNRVEKIVTLEENVKRAGFGSSIALLMAENGLTNKLFVSAIQEEFVQTGDKEYLSVKCGIDARSILKKISVRWEI